VCFPSTCKSHVSTALKPFHLLISGFGVRVPGGAQTIPGPGISVQVVWRSRWHSAPTASAWQHHRPWRRRRFPPRSLARRLRARNRTPNAIFSYLEAGRRGPRCL